MPDAIGGAVAKVHAVIRRVLMCGLFLMTTGVSSGSARSQESYLPRPSYLTTGNPAAGRQTYLELKCNTCHTVAGEPIGAKLPRLPGPQLGKELALQSPEQIADSIVAPRHIISDKPGPWRKPAHSNMGDYTHIMTVRQLIDLVAYLRSL